MFTQKTLSILLIGIACTFLTSCTCRNVPTHSSAPLPFLPGERPAISTNALEIQGNMGEKVRFDYNKKSGACESVTISNREYKDRSFACNSDEISTEIENTYFCVPVRLSGGRKGNARIAGVEEELYCGSIKMMTEGTDIQFKAELEKANRKARKQGGRAIAY